MANQVAIVAIFAIFMVFAMQPAPQYNPNPVAVLKIDPPPSYWPSIPKRNPLRW